MKRKTRLIISLILSVIWLSIAWTNESIDYLAKLGYSNINPSYAFLFSSIIFIASFVWFMVELKLK